MADTEQEDLFRYREALSLEKLKHKDDGMKQYLQVSGQTPENLKQVTQAKADMMLQAQKGAIDYTLQGQQIGGQRQLAYDRFGYDTSLQGQSQNFQAQQIDIKHAHDTELFEKQQAGRLAEQHLAQLQEQKLAMFHAGVEDDRDQARIMHETVLAKMAQEGRESMEEIIQRHADGTLMQEHAWRAEELKQQHEQEQQKIWDTHIATGIQKGVLELPQPVQAKLAQVDQQISDIQYSPKLTY